LASAGTSRWHREVHHGWAGKVFQQAGCRIEGSVPTHAAINNALQESSGPIGISIQIPLPQFDERQRN